MYFYYFRELKEDEGYGVIRISKITWFSEPFRKPVGNPITMKKWWITVEIDDNDFILPRDRKSKGKRWYNKIAVPYNEGEVFNRTFWLKDYDEKRANEIINNYYLSRIKNNSRIYTKILNSKMGVEA